MAIAVAFALGVIAMLGSERPFVRPGPHATVRELSPALGLLLATSLSEAFLLNIGPVAMKILSDDEAAPGLLLNGLIISRTPLFFFQAVKAALLPNLAAMAGRNDLHGFRDLQLRLVGAVTAVAALSVVGMGVLGPWLVEFLFGDQLGSRDMVLLAAGGGGLMIMLSLSLGLVALNHTRLAVVGFFVGVIVFPLALLTANDDFLRVEIALVAAVTAGTLVTAAFLHYEYNMHIAAGRLTARSSSLTGDSDDDQR
jgi:O-antigen/teichoic acid export membrane protein